MRNIKPLLMKADEQSQTKKCEILQIADIVRAWTSSAYFPVARFCRKSRSTQRSRKIIFTKSFVQSYAIQIENIKRFIKLTQFETRDKIARYCEKLKIILIQIAFKQHQKLYKLYNRKHCFPVPIKTSIMPGSHSNKL